MSLERRKDPLLSNRQLPLDSEEYDGFLFSALCLLDFSLVHCAICKG